MPRKLRQLRADLRRAGFSIDHQTGSHEQWKHPAIGVDRITLAGNDGADAKPYQERDLRWVLTQLRTRRIEGE